MTTEFEEVITLLSISSKRLTRLALVPALLMIACSATAGDKIFPYEYQMKDLDNGLRVVVVPTGFPNIVSLQIPVAVGSRNEVEAGKTGFAHFFEHMMFRGTKNFSSTEYGEILKNAGADQNAYTSDDITNYHITFSKDDLEQVLMLEADRFQNLEYPLADFQTEARAILGEYNKNAASPFRKIYEVMRGAAFTDHTYRHTTMGFIEDIEDMPNQFDYSLMFFDRFYRPEYTTVIVAGDVEANQVFALVEKYWGNWKPGSYKAQIPAQKPLAGPEYAHVPWDIPTLSWVTMAFRGPAFDDTKLDKAALDIVNEMMFSESSELHRKLVIDEQKAPSLVAWFPDRVEPHLLIVGALVKDPADIWYVRDQLQQTLAKARTELASSQRVEDIVAHIKYRFANTLTNTSDIAEALVPFVAHTRDPETLNRAYARYDQVTPQVIRDVANQFFTDDRMVVTTLAQGDLPEGDKLGSVNQKAEAMKVAPPEIKTVLIRNESPVINMRLVFNAGAALDPAGKAGLAHLTATYLANSGSQDMSYAEIGEALFPMAASFDEQIDKEMVTFSGTSHVNTLNSYFDIVSGQLLEPSWSQEDFERVKNNVISDIKVNLRGNNDEELGKEVLYEMIYEGHPYGHLNMGHAHVVETLTLDDVKAFYKEHFTQANLTLGLAGKFSDAFLNKAKLAFAALPKGKDGSKINLPKPTTIAEGLHVRIVEKDTRATGISMGFPIEINRSSDDFVALWLARSYFGEHRSSNSYLYQRIRKIRGMNYGDYAYIEYFPRGMSQFHPDTNLARQQQIFQIWIRPVVPEHGHFALRVAKYELEKLLKEGISQEDFEATRNYLSKFINVLTATQDRQLGYAIDSQYYGMGDFNKVVREKLAKLTVEDVNRAIRKHLSSQTMHVAIITKDAEGLKEKILSGAASPMSYDAEKPQDLLDEDQMLATYPFEVKAGNLEIIKVENVFDQARKANETQP